MKQLVEVLSDGKFHSGNALGSQLGLSRAAVWKQIAGLRELGLQIDSVKGKGYRLKGSVELIKEEEVLQQLTARARKSLGGLSVHWQLESTNRYLMDNAARLPNGQVCLAERQTAGRGRRGREWISPFGANLYLSVLWRFDKGAGALSGLSLALGVATVRALERVGVSGAALKWPNDVLWAGRKLAGILVELTGETEGPCDVVIGVGVNVNMPSLAENSIDQPWADVAEIAPVGRNRLAAALMSTILECLDEFSREGLDAFSADWRRYHAHEGVTVRLELPGRPVEGKAIGIDRTGALLLDVRGEIRAFASGEVSLRPVERHSA